MDILLLIKIILEWSIISKEYYIVFFIYENFNIGIPNSLIYKLPKNNKFLSLTNFNIRNDTLNVDDYYLNKLFLEFKKSKYKKLKLWNDKYGYIKNF